MDKPKRRKPLIAYLLPDERRDMFWKTQTKNLMSGKPVKKNTNNPNTGLAKEAKENNKDKILQVSHSKEIIPNVITKSNVGAKDISKQKNLLRPSKSLTNILDESNNDGEELNESDNNKKRKSFEEHQLKHTRTVLRAAKSSNNILLDEYDYKVHEPEEWKHFNENRIFEVSKSLRRRNVLKSAKDFMDMLQESGTLESTFANERSSIEVYQSIPPDLELRPAKSLMNMLDVYETPGSKNVNRKSLDSYQPIRTKHVLRPASSLMNIFNVYETPELKNINVMKKSEVCQSIPAKHVSSQAKSSMNMFQESELLELNNRSSLDAHKSIQPKNLRPTNYFTIESDISESNHDIHKQTLKTNKHDNHISTTEHGESIIPIDDPYENYVKELQTNNLTKKDISLQNIFMQHNPLHEMSTTCTSDETFNEITENLQLPSVFRSEVTHDAQTKQILVRPIPAKRFSKLINIVNSGVQETPDLNKFHGAFQPIAKTAKPIPKVANPIAKRANPIPKVANPIAKLLTKPTGKPTLLAKPTVIPTAKPIVIPTAKPTVMPTAKPTEKSPSKPIVKPIAQPIPAVRKNFPNLKPNYEAQGPNTAFFVSQPNVPANGITLNESQIDMEKPIVPSNVNVLKGLEDKGDRLRDETKIHILEDAICLENKRLESNPISIVYTLPEVILTRQINVGKSAVNISDESKSELRQTQGSINIKQCMAVEASQIKAINSPEKEAFAKVVDNEVSSNIFNKIMTGQANAPISIQTDVPTPEKGLLVESGQEAGEKNIVMHKDIITKALQDDYNPMSKKITLLRAVKSFKNLIDENEYEANKSFVHATNSLTRYQSAFGKKRKDTEACDKLFQLHESVFSKVYEKKPIILLLGKNVIKECHSTFKLEEQSQIDNEQSIGNMIKLFDNYTQPEDKTQDKNHTDEEKIKEYFSIKHVNPREAKYTHKDTIGNISNLDERFLPLGRAKSEADLFDAVDVVNNKLPRKMWFEGSSESILTRSVSLESIAESFRIPRVSSYNRASNRSADFNDANRCKSSIYMDDSAWVSGN